MLRAAEVARAAASKANVINMLQVPGAAESQQVMLQVRFAEVNRRALTDAGVSFFTGLRSATRTGRRARRRSSFRHRTSTGQTGWCSATS